jgi:hypothetical protein
MVLSPDLFTIVYHPISLECRILALSGTVIYARAHVCVRAIFMLFSRRNNFHILTQPTALCSKLLHLQEKDVIPSLLQRMD